MLATDPRTPRGVRLLTTTLATPLAPMKLNLYFFMKLKL